MSDLLAARLQMAVSLGFHIVFACISMVMPFLMATSHYKWLKTKEQVYLDLTKAWSKGVAIFFATGAVSGTLLSFELGLLWPEFMEHAGPIFGMPFSLEGAAFFLEAIAFGLLLYGWKKLSPWVHWWCGVAVGVCGVASGVLVVAANSWMNSPSGFELIDGEYRNIDPLAAMLNDAWLHQSIHMVIASFSATGFAVAGVHAFLLYRGNHSLFHRRAMELALYFGAIASLLQPLSGDLLAKDVAVRQPIKLAAMESHFHTEAGAGLVIGGIPRVEERRVDYGIVLPKMLSFLAFADFNAEVPGLMEFPEEEWPPVPVVHGAFQVMVGIGMVLALLSVVALYGLVKKKQLLIDRRFLLATALCTPMGFIAIEAGWTVTEVGRQPWIIYQTMTTAEALTPMPGLVYSFALYCAVYVSLTLLVYWLLKRQISVVEEVYPSGGMQWSQ